MLDAAQGAACLAAGLAEKASGPRAFLTGYGTFSLAAAFLTQPEGPRGVTLPPDAVAEDLGPDLVRLRCGIVNVAFIGPVNAGTGAGSWSMPVSGDRAPRSGLRPKAASAPRGPRPSC
ncbi:hypothetical protein ACFSYD_04315 [Paracoccus aerius]